MTEEKKDTNEEKKEEPKKEEKVYRQIIIETDGNEIRIVKSEVAGQIEFVGVLESLLNHLKNLSNKTN